MIIELYNDMFWISLIIQSLKRLKYIAGICRPGHIILIHPALNGIIGINYIIISRSGESRESMSTPSGGALTL
jgi:hypothetical protein